jgi:hypothetical protein
MICAFQLHTAAPHDLITDSNTKGWLDMFRVGWTSKRFNITDALSRTYFPYRCNNDGVTAMLEFLTAFGGKTAQPITGTGAQHAQVEEVMIKARLLVFFGHENTRCGVRALESDGRIWPIHQLNRMSI